MKYEIQNSEMVGNIDSKMDLTVIVYKTKEKNHSV